MNLQKLITSHQFSISVSTTLLLLISQAQASTDSNLLANVVDEVVVWGSNSTNDQLSKTNSISVLTQEDLTNINIATTEDIVKYEPSIIIRRRFIGDSNGTLGIRGSNMFQTSRSMVFADGVPLHYLLQSRWNGAPRWTMVSASEIAKTEIVYGPFSAEYSGNSMGGVVVIETAIPQEREFHIDGSFFSQDFDEYGFDDSVKGFKGFMSYGDKIGDLHVYVSYNHLENESQPQTFYNGGNSSSLTPIAVTGAIAENDSLSQPQLYFGDTGVVDTTTDNVKIKAGYDFGHWFALLNIAYEDRSSITDSPNSYLRDTAGNTVWGGDYEQEGQIFSVASSRLGISEASRDSLSIGLRLKGDLTDELQLELNVNEFSVLRDETRSSQSNPRDPAYTLAGQITDFGDTGWKTADAKLIFNPIEAKDIAITTGIRHEEYELAIDVYNSSNYNSGTKDNFTNRSGGQTSLTAAFIQMDWLFTDNWEISIGGRYESWKSFDGYYADDNLATPTFDLVSLPKRSDKAFSPKFSLNYQPNDQWRAQYSLAKAYRFPIVEELFSQFKAFNTISEANPDLQPEDGLHHNLLFEKNLEDGYLRINLFTETIDNAIESQTDRLAGGQSIRTFIPVDKMRTNGIEFIANAENLFIEKLDIRFNLAFIDSEIIKNDPDPSFEGNTYPRMPKWRSNLLATYHLTEKFDVGGSIQYASDSYGRIQNDDKENNVYGAQDAYTRISLKTNYQATENFKLSIGIDNITDEIAYVAHPWPGRTVYTNFSYDF